MADYIDRDNWSVKTTATTAEYIEREQALDVINFADFIADEHGLLLYADSVQACLLDIPTADVQPVVHGHWESQIVYPWKYAKCSECHRTFDVQSNFCPNCGADMRKGET